MASVFEKYPNLPGFMTEFKDGGLQVRTEPTPPGTDSVLLLGTAIDGPIGEPVAVDPNTVEAVFGSSTHPNGMPNGATLTKSFFEAYQAGSRDIRLMRITGANSVGLLKGSSVTRFIETTVSEQLGVINGNAAVTFKLNQGDIDVSSVIVNADGYDLPSSAYTVTDGTNDDPATTTTDEYVEATVNLKENVVNAGASVYITYTYIDPSTLDTVTVTENGYVNTDGTITPWVATGAAQTFPLASTPKAGTFHLYANGVEVSDTVYTIGTAPDVTIQPGFIEKGAVIEANYLKEESVTESPVVKLESIFGGAVYNQTKIKVQDILDSLNNVIGKKVVIEKPESKKGQVNEKPLEYTSLDYLTLGMLVSAINADSRNNIIRATISKRHESFETKNLDANLLTPFHGGNDGINPSKLEVFKTLGGTRTTDGLLEKPGIYHLLENYSVDTIIPLGVFADDILPGKYDNFAAQLALACAVISHRNSMTTGVIATSSPEEAGLAAIQEHVNKLLKSKNDYFMRDRAGNVLKDSDGRNIDLGRFVSVVAGPDLILTSPRLGTYADNSPASYGGFVSQLAPQSAPTNKVLPFARGLRYSYSNPQLDKLTEARYVTFKTKNNGANVAVTDAPTAAQADSDYRRLSTIRVVKEVVNELRDVCDPYIGEPNETPQRNAMSAAISKRLDILVESGVIVDYDFVVVATPQMQLMGEAQIELTIIPPQELRKITTIVSLRPSL